MADEAFVGVDLAWSARNTTGLAVVDSAGALVASGSALTDDDIDAWLSRHAPEPRIVAVDAPLIVPNAFGARHCERLITSAYGRYDSGCHSSNRGLPWMNPPRGEQLARRHSWSVDPHRPSPVCIEVYPHAAMVGLFGLGRTLKYKKGPVASRRDAMVEVLTRMSGLTPLTLTTNPRWQEIEHQVQTATRPVDLSRVEDEVDAILCAHLAWLWAKQPEALHVFGDVEFGYIVAPPAPSHPRARGRMKDAPRSSPMRGYALVSPDGRVRLTEAEFVALADGLARLRADHPPLTPDLED
jgi:predicted RNase H-like nuclease